MILKRNETLVFALLLLATFQVAVAQNQTVNIGDVYVSPETEMSIVGDFNNTSLGSFTNNGDVYAYSNWNNDGIVTFDTPILGTTAGLTRFIGDNVQNITGSDFNFLNNALFDNASTQPAFQLAGNISIATDSEYNLGIVDNDNFGGNFVFEDNANHSSTSDDSHVDGYVLKAGDDAFEYPIGDAGFYRVAGISAPDMVVDEFTAKYFFEDTNGNYPTANLSGDLTLIDASEHWEIERTSGISNVLVSLSWYDLTTPTEILSAPLADIHIARWDATQLLWVDEGGLVDTVNQSVTTIVALDTFGVFTLARVNTETPVVCSNATFINTLVTPGNDNKNDFLDIAIPDNSCITNINVQIFNRWGVEVFENDKYGLGGKYFRGFSDGRANFKNGEKLPTGTYFYILTIEFDINGSSETSKKIDYLYINGD